MRINWEVVKPYLWTGAGGVVVGMVLLSYGFGFMSRTRQSMLLQRLGCGRDASYLAPSAQIRTCSFPAYGSYLESLTAMLRLGQGWRIRGRGSHSFIKTRKICLDNRDHLCAIADH